jgi:hypothetical protein
LSISVPRKQHKLIYGPKGSLIAQITEKSGCLLDMPKEGDTIVIRGPANMLTFALQLALEKVIYFYNF